MVVFGLRCSQNPVELGRKGPSGEELREISRNFIPERYNEKTELTLEVTGPKEQNFDLKSNSALAVSTPRLLR
jgi:hypothetical protein